MDEPWNLEAAHLNLSAAGPAAGPARELREIPFRLLVVGNFRGKKSAADTVPLARRRPIRIDRDSFEEVLAKLAPRLEPAAETGGRAAAISFQSLDDFEPDQLFDRLDLFRSLVSLRRRLEDPTQFAAAAAEVRSWVDATGAAALDGPAGGSPTPPVSPQAPPPPASSLGPPGLLEQVVGDTAAARAGVPVAERAGETLGSLLGGEWTRFLREVVAPHVVARSDPRLADSLRLVDEAIGVRMRALLHDRGFQGLEAAWRTLFMLVRRLGTDSGLQLWLLDCDPDELRADLRAAPSLDQSGLYRQIAPETEITAGDPPWAAVVGLHTFSAATSDLETLAALARIAAAAGAPWIAAADGGFFGMNALAEPLEPGDWQVDPEFAARWRELRELPEARHLALVWPRVLLRPPYGRDSRPVERFPFEEFTADGSHDAYLWGPPAAAAALLLGRSFNESGWDLELEQRFEIDALPVHVFTADGDRVQKPCAEVLLHDRALDAVIAAGIVPLSSVKGHDAVRLGPLVSVALPRTILAGRWS